MDKERELAREKAVEELHQRQYTEAQHREFYRVGFDAGWNARAAHDQGWRERLFGILGGAERIEFESGDSYHQDEFGWHHSRDLLEDTLDAYDRADKDIDLLNELSTMPGSTADTLAECCDCGECEFCRRVFAIASGHQGWREIKSGLSEQGWWNGLQYHHPGSYTRICDRCEAVFDSSAATFHFKGICNEAIKTEDVICGATDNGIFKHDPCGATMREIDRDTHGGIRYECERGHQITIEPSTSQEEK